MFFLKRLVSIIFVLDIFQYALYRVSMEEVFTFKMIQKTNAVYLELDTRTS